jgi:hypothetical protein
LEKQYFRQGPKNKKRDKILRENVAVKQQRTARGGQTSILGQVAAAGRHSATRGKEDEKNDRRSEEEMKDAVNKVTDNVKGKLGSVLGKIKGKLGNK